MPTIKLIAIAIVCVYMSLEKKFFLLIKLYF
jgi:hypothetical protein